ncbi:plasmid replication protein RepC [Paracoccus rhizosphaerae]|uniref:Plasmid replication protein RepC n=1 Tax=Paracoccus rhizosphaerae TaxID=1133347 RepID=A0ABV6CM51_9RHOB|nr:plasmid replication protein RepC [Paracoccus rhizosphaerae]
MQHISITQIGCGAVPAGQKPVDPALHRPAPTCVVDKWALLKEATQAREHLGVSDRDLSVLSALLSFHPKSELGDGDQLIVFPSNASLCDRLHGMPESTLRRHVAALVRAGLVARQDSPNGKRFARRGRNGQIDRAFGFCLQPLLVRAPEIAAAADVARAIAEQTRRLREEVSLKLRDLLCLLPHSQPPVNLEIANRLADIRRTVRRKSSLKELQAVHRELLEISSHVSPAEQMSANDSQNERHYQNSETDYFESPEAEKKPRVSMKDVTLQMVLDATPDLQDYSSNAIRTWQDLLKVGCVVAPMLGIGISLWSKARYTIGDDAAATVVACILQQAGRIQRPGAYLQRLLQKAAAGSFHPAPMVIALLRRQDGLR